MSHRDPNALTILERKFLYHFLELGDQGLAYKKTYPKRRLTIKSCQESGSRMMGVIRSKEGFHEFLNRAGLGEEQIAIELKKRLNACTQKEYIVEEVTMYRGRRRTKKVVVEGAVREDNATRMRATELLARIHGKEVTKVESESKIVAAVVVLPAKATEEEWVRMVSGEKRDSQQ